MTADEIKDTPAEGRDERGWLKEIAYQLARLNERKAYDQTFRTDAEPVTLTPVRIKRK